jgi:hypothetical protein
MNDLMKIIYLYLASILIHPCPFCWVGEAVLNYIGEEGVASACCVSDCLSSCGTHSHDCSKHKNHEDKQKCPCQCHAISVTFAQIVPPINLRGITMDLSSPIDKTCCCLEKRTITNDEIVPVSVLLTVPLRI